VSAPTALVLCAPGTNRDADVAFAFELAGAATRRVLLAEAVADPKVFDRAQIVVVPGGFSFADALGAGRLFALELVTRLSGELNRCVEAGKPIIGICNGFQVLVRTGLLPGGDRRVALGHNAGGAFICDWVALEAVSQRCIWTTELSARRSVVECPIAHGEGRFVCSDDDLAALTAADQIAFRYVYGNPNGSLGDVAGICDGSGLVLGLMPHPENHVLPRQHPLHGHAPRTGLALRLFEAGVRHAQET
jgi:phosphoribosylformylglycinamidine synthase